MKTVLSLFIVSICFLTSACTSVQVWQLNDSVPHRGDSIERLRFEQRMDTFYSLHNVRFTENKWYVVNLTRLVVKVPYGMSAEFKERIPSVACNPEADENKCHMVSRNRLK